MSELLLFFFFGYTFFVSWLPTTTIEGRFLVGSVGFIGLVVRRWIGNSFGQLFANNCQVVGPLLTSLPKVESSGGDDGPTAAAGTNIGVNVDHLPLLAVAPDGTQHIIQVITPILFPKCEKNLKKENHFTPKRIGARWTLQS